MRWRGIISCRGLHVGGLDLVGCRQGLPESLALVIRLPCGGLCGVQTPLGQQRLGDLEETELSTRKSSVTLSYLLWSGELEDAGLLGHDGALVLGREAGYQLRHEPAGLLGVEVADLLRHVHQAGDDLVVALLRSLLEGAAGPADLDGKFLTGGVSHELAWLFLHILGAAGGLVHSPTLLRSLPVTDFLHRFVALLHSLVVGLLLKGAEMCFIKIILKAYIIKSHMLHCFSKFSSQTSSWLGVNWVT